MSEPDFTIELNSEVLPKPLEYSLYTEAESRLKRLAKGHSDLIGAAISIRQQSSGENFPHHEVSIVVYSRPENVAAKQKQSDPQMALKAALDAVERQIRERREKLGKRWQQPGNLPMEQEITEVVAAETEEQGVDHG
jgi:ribosome-associated translation inhibitor RaiA